MDALPDCRFTQFGVFTTDQARSSGLSRHQLNRLLRKGVLQSLRRGVYVDSEQARSMSAATHARAAAVAAALAWRDSVISHHSAALVHGLPMIGRVPRRPALTLPIDGGRHGSAADPSVLVRVARLPAEHVCQRGAWRVTTPARTICDLAAELSPPHLLAAADGALAHRLTSSEQLQHTAAQVGDRPGSRTLRRVLPLASPLPESPYESVARWQLASAALLVVPQVWAYDPDGPIGCVDLWLPKMWTALEIDGDVKYVEGPPAALLDEKRRQERLEAAGFGVARIAPRELAHPDALGRLVRATRRGRASRAASRATGWVGPPPAWSSRGAEIVVQAAPAL